ncbi:MAG TPA: hypothetical protein VGD62_00505 [Acidobacteriaceae bacterium]
MNATLEDPSMLASPLRFTLLTALLCSAGMLPAQQVPVLATPAVTATDSLTWMPQGTAQLTEQSSWHTAFTLDRPTLGLLSKLPTLDTPTRDVVARLNGIAVHVYRFTSPASYDAAALETIRSQYNTLGWKHVVSKGGPAANGTFDSTEQHARTDVWLQSKGINFAGATILLAGPTNVELIAVSGDISTLDLLRLRGHFGIPDFPDSGLAH